jgi:hypothetical protein
MESRRRFAHAGRIRAVFWKSIIHRESMQSPSVMILASDRDLAMKTAWALTNGGCEVRAGPAGATERPMLIVRDWRDDRHIDGLGVPVLTVDLAVLAGRELVELVYRTLGLAGTPSFTTLCALLLLLEGRVPEA